MKRFKVGDPAILVKTAYSGSLCEIAEIGDYEALLPDTGEYIHCDYKVKVFGRPAYKYFQVGDDPEVFHNSTPGLWCVKDEWLKPIEDPDAKKDRLEEHNLTPFPYNQISLKFCKAVNKR